MTKPKYILVAAGEPSELLLMRMKEIHGENIELVTPQKAAEMQLPSTAFANNPPMKIINPYPQEEALIDSPKTGKMKRNIRRAEERKKRKGR